MHCWRSAEPLPLPAGSRRSHTHPPPRSCPCPRRRADAFGRCPLFIGGPVTKNLLHVLHGRREVDGALEIVEGVFAGGVESASEMVRRGEASPHDFMLLAGYSGWGPGQLAQELAEGTWLVVAASQAVILDCLQGECGG